MEYFQMTHKIYILSVAFSKPYDNQIIVSVCNKNHKNYIAKSGILIYINIYI